MRSNRIVWRWSLLPLLGFMPVLQARAQEPLRFGVQVGLAVPVSDDLRVTTHTGMNPALGVHAAWDFRARQTLRVRFDAENYCQDRQVADMPGLHQEIRTKVRTESLGAELLHRLPGDWDRWSLGAGIYAIRWQVASTNQLVTAAGQISPSGSDHWTREGLGVLAQYRWCSRSGLELRYLASHYGQENQPARVLTTSFFWHF